MRRPSVDFIFFTVLFALMALVTLILWARSVYANELSDAIKPQSFSCPIEMYPYANNGLYGCRKYPSPLECALAAIGRYDTYAEMLGVSIDLTRRREPFISERRKFVGDSCDP